MLLERKNVSPSCETSCIVAFKGHVQSQYAALGELHKKTVHLRAVRLHREKAFPLTKLLCVLKFLQKGLHRFLLHPSHNQI